MGTRSVPTSTSSTHSLPIPAWWEDWYKKAMAAGVPEDVADAGRALVRSLYVDDDESDRWDCDIVRFAGFDDDGYEMIQRALAHPRAALTMWRRVAETRGLRGEQTEVGWQPWSRRRRNREKHSLLSEWNWLWSHLH